MTLKIAVLAPIPTARVTIAMDVKSGALESRRETRRILAGTFMVRDNDGSDSRQVQSTAAQLAGVRHGPVQPPVPVLHARAGVRLAATAEHPRLRGDRRHRGCVCVARRR